MKRRGLALLAIVAAGMAVLIFVEGRRRSSRESEQTRPTASARMLPPFDRKAVRRITIHRLASGQAFSMLHLPSPSAPAPAPAWQIEGPGTPAGDDAAIDDLVAAADLAESNRTADLSPEAAGLHPAEAELDIETPGGAMALQLGRADATGQGVYARVGPDGPVRVIGRRLLDLVDRGPEAFRDRRLLPLDPAAVTAIKWSGDNTQGAVFALGGRWHKSGGESVANERVTESLRQLLALRIEKFDTEPPRPPAGARTLKVTAGPAEIALDIWPGGEVTRDGERLRVPADAIETAWRSLAPASARDDRLVVQPPDAITRVELSDDHARLALRRVHGEWSFESPKVPYAADTRAVDDWLTRLHAVKAATKSDGPHARHLVIEGHFPERADVSAPPDVHALLAPDPLRFRDRAVLSFAHFDVRRLVRTGGNTTEQVTTSDGGTWHTTTGAPADAAKIARVVTALSELRAQEFIAAPPASAPAVRLEIDVQPPGDPRPTRHAVQIWARNDNCVARFDRDAAAFTLEPTTCTALRFELLAK